MLVIMARPPSGTNPPSEARFAGVGDYLQGKIDDGSLNAVAVLIHIDGAPRYIKALGWRDREAGEVLQHDAIFRLGSMSKPVTCVAAMQLYERGVFALDDPVEQYLPEFVGVKVWNPEGKPRKPSRAITMRDLMLHTSGLAYPFNAPEPLQALYIETGFSQLASVEPVRMRDRLPQLMRIPLAHDPGERMTYGHNIDVLGLLLEAWSGKTLDVCLRENLFEPLGMTDTGFYLEREKLPRLAQMYTRDQTNALRISSELAMTLPEDSPWNFSFWEAILHPDRGAQTWLAGGGGLRSTLADYSRFVEMLLNGGVLDGVRVIGAKTLELMRSEVTCASESQVMAEIGFGLRPGVQQGIGVGVVKAPEKIGSGLPGGSFLWGGAFNTMFWVDPINNLYVVMMGQLMPDDRREIRNDLECEIYRVLGNI